MYYVGQAWKPALAGSAIALGTALATETIGGAGNLELPLVGSVSGTVALPLLVGASIYVGDVVSGTLVPQILPFMPQSVDHNLIVPALTSGFTGGVSALGIRAIDPNIDLTSQTLFVLGAGCSLGGHYIANTML
jgi:hypothetical protein